MMRRRKRVDHDEHIRWDTPPRDWYRRLSAPERGNLHGLARHLWSEEEDWYGSLSRAGNHSLLAVGSTLYSEAYWNRISEVLEGTEDHAYPETRGADIDLVVLDDKRDGTNTITEDITGDRLLDLIEQYQPFPSERLQRTARGSYINQWTEDKEWQREKRYEDKESLKLTPSTGRPIHIKVHRGRSYHKLREEIYDGRNGPVSVLFHRTHTSMLRDIEAVHQEPTLFD